MIAISVNINPAAANATLKAIGMGLQDRTGMHASMAAAVEHEVRDHLVRNYTGRTRRGDFWQRVHDSVESRFDAAGATVSLNELGIALRYFGGDVFPGRNMAASGPNKGKPTRALAVPSDAVPVRSGRQLPPAKMGLLAFIRAVGRGETVGWLVEGMAKPNKKGRTRIVPKPGGSLLYTLRSVTHHRADKKILPEEARLSTAAAAAIAAFIGSFEG